MFAVWRKTGKPTVEPLFDEAPAIEEVSPPPNCPSSARILKTRTAEGNP